MKNQTKSRQAAYTIKDTFAIVLARDEKGILEKHAELEQLGIAHVIVCGIPIEFDGVIYRPAHGKYDAINFGLHRLPKDVPIVVLNDVDTKIVNFERALRHFADPKVGLVFTRVELPNSEAHSMFNRLIDSIRRRFLIAANGELMYFRREIVQKLTPIQPCKAEDSLLLYETLNLGYRAVFESESHVITSRTSASSLRNEEIFKRKVVCGIYQALSLSNAPLSRRFFYSLLPFASPLLLLSGKKGWFWMRGIIFGLVDFLKGDRSGYWAPTYK